MLSETEFAVLCSFKGYRVFTRGGMTCSTTLHSRVL